MCSACVVVGRRKIHFRDSVPGRPGPLQSRPSRPVPEIGGSVPDLQLFREMPPPLSDFSCAICLETLHKPAVSHCGHAYCFWCFHRAMGLSTSHCPLCRAELRHFAAICEPLAAYVGVHFPAEAAAREEQTAQQERDEWRTESPVLQPPLGAGTPASFACAGCQRVAVPPAVLTCGHVVCARARGWPTCPVRGCVGFAPSATTGSARDESQPSGPIAICGLIDAILQTDYEDYDTVRAAEFRAECMAECAADAPEASGVELEVNSSCATVGSTAGVAADGAAGGAADGAADGAAEGAADGAADGGVAGGAGDATGGEAGGAAGGAAANRTRSARSTESYTHFGRGCDGCGVYPVRGRCYKCADCSGNGGAAHTLSPPCTPFARTCIV